MESRRRREPRQRARLFAHAQASSVAAQRRYRGLRVNATVSLPRSARPNQTRRLASGERSAAERGARTDSTRALVRRRNGGLQEDGGIALCEGCGSLQVVVSYTR